MNDDFGNWYEDYYDKKKDDKFCFHEWVPILLLISTVYDCKKCGTKKEDYERRKVQGRG